MSYPIAVQPYIIRRDFIAAVQVAETIPDMDPQARSLLRVLATLQFSGGAPYRRAVDLFECPDSPFWLHASQVAQDDRFEPLEPDGPNLLLAAILAVLYAPADSGIESRQSGRLH